MSSTQSVLFLFSKKISKYILILCCQKLASSFFSQFIEREREKKPFAFEENVICST